MDPAHRENFHHKVVIQLAGVAWVVVLAGVTWSWCDMGCDAAPVVCTILIWNMDKPKPQKKTERNHAHGPNEGGNISWLVGKQSYE